MSKETKDIKTIFSEALEKHTTEERVAYLDEACGNDADLRSKIEALIKAHEHAGDFLKLPALGPDVILEEFPSIEGPGTKIGHYELLELIGEGGMGLVYLAQQTEPVKRRVALKIVKLGMDTKQVIARFEAERQTLALLEHPNIAHVFDAGTTDSGRPYFVMEYVEGKSIIKYCDEYKLSIEERLKLFRQVCDGVHHAHQKGIIHRDIKPSNILVSVQDDKAVLKIIDFGIAKAITQPLTARTSYTEQGQLLGTPEYMSPEQAEMAYQEVDTRSDIYSLGVVLYELLTGVTPFDAKKLREGGIDHIQQVICEEEPRTPSARLTSLGDKAKEVAQSRRTQIITLTRRLHRELEWIPMKAMRKDQTRRYKSASELTDDIQNYLTGAPLIAGPESTVYRARKFVQKHAGFVASAVLVAVVIVIGLITSIAFSFSAEKARGEEAAARTRAEQAREAEVIARIEVEQALLRAEKAEKIAQERANKYRNLSYVHGIALADAKYREGNILNARHLLRSSPADLRNWEWHRLNYIVDESLFTFGPGDYAIAFSPDGKWIASQDSRKWSCNPTHIKIWDATTGKEIRTLRGEHGALVVSLAFTSDGKRIVSGSRDKLLKIWDANSGEELMTLAGHEVAIASLDLSTNDKRIVSMDYGGAIKVWDADDGEELLTINTVLEKNEIRYGKSVAMSPDGKRIIADTNSKRVCEWDAATGKQLRTFSRPDQSVRALQYSPDGQHIAMGCNAGMLKIVDRETEKEMILMEGKGGDSSVRSLSFSPDGQRLVSSGDDRMVRVWDTSTGKELMILAGHTVSVSKVIFSPDGQRIASSADKKIKVWDANVDRKRIVLRGHKERVRSLAFSPDGRRLVSVCADNTVKVWDVSTGRGIITLSGHEDRIWSATFSPDGKHIATGSKDGTIRIWNASTSAEVRKITGDIGEIYSVAFSPDGKRLASGGSDGPVKVWDAFMGNELLALEGEDGKMVHTIAFNAEGTRIVTCRYRWFSACVWDASTGEKMKGIPGHRLGTSSVVFSPDGKQIISGGYDAAVKIWDMSTGNELMMLLGHKDNVYAVAVSPDGKRIVSSSYHSAKVWDTETGAELMTIAADRDQPIVNVAFSPDGKTIAGAGGPQEGDISFWQSGNWETAGSSKGQMVACWDFERFDEKTVKDSSGNGLDGRLVGDAHVIEDPNRGGQVLHLDGDEDWVDCGKDSRFDITSEITVSAWIKVNSFNKAYQTVISKGRTAWTLQRYMSSENLSFACRGVSVSRSNVGGVHGAINVNDGKWHHVVGVYDGVWSCLYFDGVLNRAEEAAGEIGTNDYAVLIGANEEAMAQELPDRDRSFDGLIDDVRVYDYALPEAEIKQLFEKSKSAPNSYGEVK